MTFPKTTIVDHHFSPFLNYNIFKPGPENEKRRKKTKKIPDGLKITHMYTNSMYTILMKS